MGVPLVADVNVLVAAVDFDDPSTAEDAFPAPPPVRGRAEPLLLGALLTGDEFSLWLSPHILRLTERVLTEAAQWSKENTSRYCQRLRRVADLTGGGVVTPNTNVSDCKDWEDNRILELAETVGAFLIVSNDDDLISMSPWRGIVVLDAAQFVGRVDAMRRHSGR